MLTLAVVCIGIYTSDRWNTSTIQIKPVIETTPKQEKTGIEQVMSRAEFKKQQELLAKEIFLTEEKQRIETELKTKIDSIEKQLEEVRSQKTSF